MGMSATAIELAAQSLDVLTKLAAQGSLDDSGDAGNAELRGLKKHALGIVSVHITTRGGGRLHALACEAFDGLVEYHRKTLVEDSRERIVLRAVSQVVGTGHDQTDYEALRDAIERIAEATASDDGDKDMGTSDNMPAARFMDGEAGRQEQVAVHGIHVFDIGAAVASCDAQFIRLSRIGWSGCASSDEAAEHVRGFLSRWASEGKGESQLAPGFGLVANRYGEITHRIGLDGTLRLVKNVQCGQGHEATVTRIWQFTLGDDEDYEGITFKPGSADTWAAFLMGKKIKRRTQYADVREE